MAEVFIVEENLQHSLRLQQLVLRTGDHRVDTFISPDHVILELRRRADSKERFPDLLFAELDPNDPAGQEVLRFCRDTLACKSMKIFAVTGGVTPEQLQQCRELGADECAERDLADDRLEAAIRRLLGPLAA